MSKCSEYYKRKNKQNTVLTVLSWLYFVWFNSFFSVWILQESPIWQNPCSRCDDFCHREGQPEPVQTDSGKQKTQRNKAYYGTDHCQHGTFGTFPHSLQKYRENQCRYNGDKTASNDPESDSADLYHQRIRGKYTQQEVRKGLKAKNPHRHEYNPEPDGRR